MTSHGSASCEGQLRSVSTEYKHDAQLVKHTHSKVKIKRLKLEFQKVKVVVVLGLSVLF
jgi:hypothetical protein